MALKKVYKKGNNIVINDIINFLKNVDENKIYLVDIKEEKDIRSLNQNKYLWGVIYKMIGSELGYDVDTVHEVFKQKFGIKKELRKGIIIAVSSTKYDTKEMTTYIDSIKDFASQFLNLYIPAPESNLAKEIYLL